MGIFRMSLRIYGGNERHLWGIQCCRRVSTLFLSDSQARDLTINDLPPNSNGLVIRGGSYADALARS